MTDEMIEHCLELVRSRYQYIVVVSSCQQSGDRYKMELCVVFRFSIISFFQNFSHTYNLLSSTSTTIVANKKYTIRTS